MKKLLIGILKNEIEDDHASWIKACEKYSNFVDYYVIDLFATDWIEQIEPNNPNVLVAKPSGQNSFFKNVYDEKVRILSEELGYDIYPSPKEIYFYENKRYLSFWLEANKIPHPSTNILFSQKAVDVFIDKNKKFPVVAKTNIGAAGSGVKILNNKQEVRKYSSKVFSGKGAPKRCGPNFKKKGIIKRGLKYLVSPNRINAQIKSYISRKRDKQTNFVLFQEYIPHTYEWRVVRIGDSFFAHKKVKKGDMASGTIEKVYDNPTLKLFDFVKKITDKHQLFSQAIDLFEFQNSYYINEMQCIFGQSDPFQMKINGKIGRYVWKNGEWVFEEGDFNSNKSYDLRLRYLLRKYGY